jgi:hypothetical protein
MAFYDKLFSLCGFDPGELEAERHRIEKVLTRLELGPDDIDHACEHVRAGFEIDLKGVQRALGAWLIELIDLVLAKEDGKKIVYFDFPAIFGPQWMLKCSSDDVYAASPDMIVCNTLGQIFDKLRPIQEAGEQNGTPPGHGLCSLWTIKLGALAKGYIPVPDVAIASSYFCDMGSKGGDILTELYGVTVAHVDSCMDFDWGVYPECSTEKIKFFGNEINAAFKLIEDTIDIQFKPEGMMQAMDIIMEFQGLVMELGALVSTDPQPVSTSDQNLFQPVILASTGRSVQMSMQALRLLIEETRARVDAGFGVVEKGAPRVIVFLYNHADSRIAGMMEACGLAIPASFINFYAMVQPEGRVINPMDYQSPGEFIAASEMLNGMFHSSFGIIEKYRLVTQFAPNVDGIIYNFLHHCRPSCITSHTSKKYLEEQTHLPVLSLEFDIWDSRNYSAESLRIRIETFAEMLKAKKCSMGRT